MHTHFGRSIFAFGLQSWKLKPNLWNRVALVLIALLIPILSPASISRATPATGTAVTVATGAQGAYPYLVWNVGHHTSEPFVTNSDQYDVMGLNLQTNQPITVAAALNNQTAPRISGSVVVWQDNSQSCPMCEHDIIGRDLSTGQTYSVATGSQDQSLPAIYGTSVAWVELLSDGTERLLLGQLSTTTLPTVVDSVSGTSGFTLGEPVISNEYIVWAQIANISPSTPVPTSGTQAPPTSQIKAYNRSTGVTTTVGSFAELSTQYALADHRVVWNNGYLRLLDLNTQVETVIYDGETYSPTINGNTIAWSMRSTSYTEDFDIWGVTLPDGNPTPLIVESGNQVQATIVPGGPSGSILAWQNEASPDYWLTTEGRTNEAEISTKLLDEAFASPAPLPEQATQTPTATPSGDTPEVAPLVKGMHACNGEAWTSRPLECVNALGADRNRSYFGAVTILASDLMKDTTRTDAWGPKVRDAMQTLLNSGVRVTVRTDPTKGMTQGTEPHTEELLQQVRDVLRDFPGAHDVQINNEPNLEWPASCNGCRYFYDRSFGESPPYTWANRQDYRFYHAISDFYMEAYGTIHWYGIECSPSNDPYCDPIRSMKFWTPPMAECYCHTVGPTELPYRILEQVTYTYQEFGEGFSYHVYPAPNGDGNFGGTLFNPAFPWFTSRMQTDVDRLPSDPYHLQSQISEWGWDPQRMRDCIPGDNGPFGCNNLDRHLACGIDQNEIWPGSGGGISEAPLPYPMHCLANDGRDHYFENDAINFLAAPQELHRAQSVYVWIIKRGQGADYSDDADGLGSTGQPLRWFLAYQAYQAP